MVTAVGLVLGLITGGLGDVLATPLVAVFVVSVQILHVREVLGRVISLLET